MVVQCVQATKNGGGVAAAILRVLGSGPPRLYTTGDAVSCAAPVAPRGARPGPLLGKVLSLNIPPSAPPPPPPPSPCCVVGCGLYNPAWSGGGEQGCVGKNGVQIQRGRGILQEEEGLSLEFPAQDTGRPGDESPVKPMGHKCPETEGRTVCLTFHGLDVDKLWLCSLAPQLKLATNLDVSD